MKQDSITQKLIAPEKLAAPIKAGQTIGKLVVYQDGRTLTEFELTAPADIDKAGWWTLFKRTAAHLFL